MGKYRKNRQFCSNCSRNLNYFLTTYVNIHACSGSNIGSLGENTMLRTIIMSTCVQVQGTFVRALSDGRIVVSVDNRDFAGQPI